MRSKRFLSQCFGVVGLIAVGVMLGLTACSNSTASNDERASTTRSDSDAPTNAVGGADFDSGTELPKQTAAGGWKFTVAAQAIRYFQLNLDRPTHLFLQLSCGESTVDLEVYDAEKSPLKWPAEGHVAGRGEPKFEKRVILSTIKTPLGRLAEEHIVRVDCEHLPAGRYYVSLRNRDAATSAMTLETRIASSTWTAPAEWEPK